VATQTRVDERDEDWFVDALAQYVPPGGWPQKFRAVVVSVERGEVRLLRPADGVDLARGIAASCAAPGIIAPIALYDGMYVDGGARSATNADLVARFDVAQVIVASPIVPDTPIVGSAISRVLDAEIRELRSRGIEVSSVQASEIEADAFGFDLLNLANVPAAIEAGRERGRREGNRLLTE
jgi:NTE family protein